MTTDVTKIHELKETLNVDIYTPGHEARITTPLFTKTRKQLIERESGRCWICHGTAEETGHPLEAHHHPIERSLANMIDWGLFKNDCIMGKWGANAQAFKWEDFDPANPYSFVDDMMVNGLLLCKGDHTQLDSGIHTLPFPIWIAQRYAKEGYQFSPAEVIHHFDQEAV